MRAPRVLVSGVVLGQPAGGVRRHNAELLPRLAELLAREGGSLALLEGRTPVAFALPASVERIASDVPAAPVLFRAAREGRALQAELARAAVAGRAYDLVHTGHLPAPRGLSVPFTLTVHDLRSLDRDAAPLARRLLAPRVVGSAIARAAAVITVGESVRREILARFDVAPERVHVVPNAADHFEPLPRATGPDAPLLCIGHLEPRKNQELLLRALACAQRLPSLVCAGAAKGGELARLQALARELGIEARVRFLGSVDDAELAGLYARAACVVVPSRIEGFGIVAVEAQRARAPLAIARIDALVEAAGPETPSFAPDDPRECAAAITRALETTPRAIEAAARSAERFSWDRSAERWFEVLVEAASRPR